MEQQIADPFFAVCRSLVELDDAEEEIARKLQKSVNEEIEERNAFAHHDWYVARWSSPDADVPVAERLGLKASSKKNAERRVMYKPADIDKLARRVEGLRNVVWEVGTICTKQDAYDPAKERPAPRIKSRSGSQTRFYGSIPEHPRTLANTARASPITTGLFGGVRGSACYVKESGRPVNFPATTP